MKDLMDSFVVQVVVDDKSVSAQPLCASAPLHLAAAPSAFGGDKVAWEFLRAILRGFVMEVLQGRGAQSMLAACEFLQEPLP